MIELKFTSLIKEDNRENRFSISAAAIKTSGSVHLWIEETEAHKYCKVIDTHLNGAELKELISVLTAAYDMINT